MTDDKDTYTVRLFCGNCGQNTVVEIPKGMSIKDYVREHECSTCGCTTLREAWV